MARIDDYAGKAGRLPSARPGPADGADRAQFRPAPRPDWTDIETYSDFPVGELTIGRTGDVPPAEHTHHLSRPIVTPAQAADELLMRRYRREAEEAERIEALQEHINRLSSAERYYRGLANESLENARHATCTPSRSEMLSRPMPAWVLWSFVAAPVVIGVLGIAVGLALR